VSNCIFVSVTRELWVQILVFPGLDDNHVEFRVGIVLLQEFWHNPDRRVSSELLDLGVLIVLQLDVLWDVCFLVVAHDLTIMMG